VCDKSYFEGALRKLDPEETRTVLVFSDDEKWPKTHLSELHSKIVFIDDNFDALESFIIMQHCRGGQIISNSTFSWWAAYVAWIQSDRTVPVVCPKQWFAAEDKNVCESMQCDGWHPL